MGNYRNQKYARPFLVTIHAAERYAERFLDVKPTDAQIRTLRKKLETPELRRAVGLGASRFVQDGVVYVIANGVVKTILTQTMSTGRVRRKQETPQNDTKDQQV